MKLKQEHKEAVIQWLAEGLSSTEINERAEVFHMPFDVSRRQVSYYRKQHSTKIAEAKKVWIQGAIERGLATKEVRTLNLQQLAQLIKDDLVENGLWAEDRKGIGAGEAAEVYDYLRFKKAEMDTYRGILNDIALEVGDRVRKTEHTGEGGEPIRVKLYMLGGIDEGDI